MVVWTKPILIDKKFDASRIFGDSRGIYQFSISRNIAYPKKSGKIIFIGKHSDLGAIISQHLKKSSNKSLKSYIKMEKKLYVSVKKPRSKSRTYLKMMQDEALTGHINKYGIVPICNK